MLKFDKCLIRLAADRAGAGLCDSEAMGVEELLEEFDVGAHIIEMVIVSNGWSGC